MVRSSEPIPIAVMGVLLMFSLLSWTVIFSKWFLFRRAGKANKNFLRAFRKADRMDAIAAASQQFTAAPLVAVFDFGYSEVNRQVTKRGHITNPVAVERNLQLGISEEVAKLERSMSFALRGIVWNCIRHHRSVSSFRTHRLYQHADRGSGNCQRAVCDRIGSLCGHPRSGFL
jgi:hypothetical protein